jgi:hypothetical protein
VEAAAIRPISSAPSRKASARFTLVFCSVFLLIGAVMGYFVTVRPVLGVLAARGWTPTPCTILSSEVRSHRGSKSTTYSADIHYAYEVDGRPFHSDRAKFMGGSSSGRGGKMEFVRRYPGGAKATCYVNPRDPSDAVLERGFTSDMWVGLVPALCMLIGAGGIIATLRKGRTQSSERSAIEPVSIRQIVGGSQSPFASESMFEEVPGTRVLRSSQSRVVTVIVIAVFAAVWNGVVFFGFIQGTGFFRRGHASFFDWFTTLFMLPFIAVGLAVIGVLVYQVLALFNPKVEASIQPGSPRLGGSLDLSWRLMGRTQILRNLKVFLEGREEATYRRGTSTYTDRKPFLKLELAATSNPTDMAAGQARITLPLDTVPSFKSDNNKIVWAVKVEGDIARWPDLKEEFEIPVLPPPMSQS